MATVTASQQIPLIQSGGIGQYKDFAQASINSKNELEGTEEFQKAAYPHYLPAWDNEKGEK